MKPNHSPKMNYITKDLLEAMAFLKFLFVYFLRVWAFCLHTHTHTPVPCVLEPATREDRKVAKISLNWSYKWFWGAMWILGIRQRGCSGRTASALGHWATSPAPAWCFKFIFSYFFKFLRNENGYFQTNRHSDTWEFPTNESTNKKVSIPVFNTCILGKSNQLKPPTIYLKNLQLKQESTFTSVFIFKLFFTQWNKQNNLT